MPPKNNTKKRSSIANASATKAAASPFWSVVRTGFALGLGSFAAALIFVMIGVSLTVGGYALRNKEQAKPEKEQDKWKIHLGLALMLLGVVIAGGAGLSSLLGEVTE